jgi:hypothetical protein
MQTRMTPVVLVAAAMACLLMPGAPAAAQQPTLHDDLLDRLVGRWTLSGTIAGRQTTHDVDAEWALNHQYLKIHEVSRERDDDGRPQYEANAFIGWHESRRRYVCFWLDGYGGGFAGTGFAERQSNQLPFTFGDEKGAFHTTFLFDPVTDSWQWLMDSEQQGSRQPFARLGLTRASTAPSPAGRR